MAELERITPRQWRRFYIDHLPELVPSLPPIEDEDDDGRWPGVNEPRDDGLDDELGLPDATEDEWRPLIDDSDETKWADPKDFPEVMGR